MPHMKFLDILKYIGMVIYYHILWLTKSFSPSLGKRKCISIIRGEDLCPLSFTISSSTNKNNYNFFKLKVSFYRLKEKKTITQNIIHLTPEDIFID